MVNDFINNVVQQLAASGLKIDLLTSSSDREHTFASKAISYTTTTNVGKQIEKKSTVYVSRSWIGSKDAGKYYEYLKHDISNIYRQQQNLDNDENLVNDEEVRKALTTNETLAKDIEKAIEDSKTQNNNPKIESVVQNTVTTEASEAETDES